jgi:hypothetical protein
MIDAEDDLFLMSNLTPADTGLPMVVWVSVRGYAQHDVRVKVNTTHGSKTSPTQPMAIFRVRPTPGMITGYVPPADERAVERWVALNEAVLVDYWESRISTKEMLQQIQPLSPPVP